MGTQPQVDRRSAADSRRAWPPRRLHAAVCEQAQYTAVRVEPLAELENPAVHVVDAA